MLSHFVLSKNILRNIACLFIILGYLFIILNFFTLPILVLISIITILMCLINRIYYGSPILLLSFYYVTEEQFLFLM